MYYTHFMLSFSMYRSSIFHGSRNAWFTVVEWNLCLLEGILLLSSFFVEYHTFYSCICDFNSKHIHDVILILVPLTGRPTDVVVWGMYLGLYYSIWHTFMLDPTSRAYGHNSDSSAATIAIP